MTIGPLMLAETIYTDVQVFPKSIEARRALLYLSPVRPGGNESRKGYGGSTEGEYISPTEGELSPGEPRSYAFSLDQNRTSRRATVLCFRG